MYSVSFHKDEHDLLEKIEQQLEVRFLDVRQRGTHFAVFTHGETLADEVRMMRDEMRRKIRALRLDVR